MTEDKKAIKGKRKARKFALQALYQWHMNHDDVAVIEAQFRVAVDMDKVDVEYFCRLLHGVPKELSHLEASFEPFLDRKLTDLTPIELTVLRLSAFELHHCLETPYKVVLDEAINLSKEYGTPDGYKYVNGVLNGLAKKVRTEETK